MGFRSKQLHLEHKGFLRKLNWASSLGAKVGNFLKLKLKPALKSVGNGCIIFRLSVYLTVLTKLYMLSVSELLGLTYISASFFLLASINRLRYTAPRSSVCEMQIEMWIEVMCTTSKPGL